MAHKNQILPTSAPTRAASSGPNRSSESMFRYITMASMLVVQGATYLHDALGGLIIGMNDDGSKWFSNELLSSGSDDSGLVSTGFYSFSLTVAFYFFARSNKPFVYYANLLFLYFVLFLANLDVSIIGSIRYGDYPLAILLVVVHVPALYHLKSKSSRAA